MCNPDYKISKHYNGVKAKTFCYCAGASGGRIKFTDYGPFTILDGHTESSGDQRNENLAILLQLRHKTGQPFSFQEVMDLIIVPYQKARVDSPGRPITQWYPDFKNDTLTLRTVDALEDRSSLHSPIRDYGVSNLASLLPDGYKSVYVAAFEELLSNFHPNAVVDEMLQHVAVRGIELESLWDEVVLRDGMESSLNGLYVIGDCAGVAQGILQAATMGVAAANHCVMSLDKAKYHET